MVALSIVIPCYNEEGNIPLITQRLRSLLEGRKDIEIVFVNNGSTDNSATVFERQISGASGAGFKVVNVPVNQGYGHGILQGLAEATGHVLSWTHADMQTDPADVIKAYDLFIASPSDNIVVKGKRLNRGCTEAFFTFGMQLVACLALGVYIDDINAQPKVFSRDFYERFLRKSAPNDFSIDLYALYQAKKNGYHTLEVPVFFTQRLYGEAKGGGGSWRNRIKLIKRTFLYIFELKRAYSTR